MRTKQKLLLCLIFSASFQRLSPLSETFHHFSFKELHLATLPLPVSKTSSSSAVPSAIRVYYCYSFPLGTLKGISRHCEKDSFRKRLEKTVELAQSFSVDHTALNTVNATLCQQCFFVARQVDVVMP